MSEVATEESKPTGKPSEVIEALTSQLMLQVKQGLLVQVKEETGETLTLAELEETLAENGEVSPADTLKIGTMVSAIIAVMDAEHERRIAWEKRVEAFARDQGVEI